MSNEPSGESCITPPAARTEPAIVILTDALEMAANRFADLADIIERDGKYTNVGFFRASAERCRAAQADGLAAAALTEQRARPIADDRRLRLCGYCETWRMRPCGDGCYWMPNGKTVQEIAKATGNASERTGRTSE